MSKKANPTMVGMFVIGAVALVVAAVLIVAGDTLLQDRRQFVAVFEGSVKGLRVGANVMFRGVRVGYVTDINVVLDEDQDYFFVPVVFETIPPRYRSCPAVNFGTSQARTTASDTRN